MTWFRQRPRVQPSWERGHEDEAGCYHCYEAEAEAENFGLKATLASGLNIPASFALTRQHWTWPNFQKTVTYTFVLKIGKNRRNRAIRSCTFIPWSRSLQNGYRACANVSVISNNDHFCTTSVYHCQRGISINKFDDRQTDWLAASMWQAHTGADSSPQKVSVGHQLLAELIRAAAL